ncbi:MAG: response regulator [bacterium]|nr:response regulator [bacterium]
MNKILIVEDEEFLIRALKDNLESEGCSVDTAANGEEAVEHIKKMKPDIILLDLLMPKKDGFYVLEEIKKNSDWKLIPVIVLSNLGGDADIKQALAMGANDYFIKSQHPIEEVIEKIKAYLV